MTIAVSHTWSFRAWARSHHHSQRSHRARAGRDAAAAHQLVQLLSVFAKQFLALGMWSTKKIEKVFPKKYGDLMLGRSPTQRSIPVVPARGGAEVALQILYKTSLIYRTCMCRALARPVRACFVPSCCTDVVQEHDLRATPAQCNAKRTLSSHLTLALRTPHFTSSQIMWALLTPSHLIASLLTCHLSKFFSTVFISSEHWSTFLSPGSSSQLISALLHARKFLLSDKNLFHTKTLQAEKPFPHRSLGHR